MYLNREEAKAWRENLDLFHLQYSKTPLFIISDVVLYVLVNCL